MSGYSLQTSPCAPLGRPWLTVLILVSLTAGWTAADAKENAALSWRSEQLETIAGKIQDADADDERLEYVAQQAWLRRWKPGRMPPAPKLAPIESELVEEPLLEKLNVPTGVDPKAWQQMVALQTRLHAVDTDEERKTNLRTIIGLASELEEALFDQLSSESQELSETTGWVLAYTRYRLGRALAYRELPVVRERWPIANPDQYQEELLAVYQRLTNQANRGRPEFILLEDRILRRAGKKGLALELLEANRQSIEPKWYLKKRRDLLRELGWDPPYQEAARLYLEAGYRDET